jgi:hypothetical protein
MTAELGYILIWHKLEGSDIPTKVGMDIPKGYLLYIA